MIVGKKMLMSQLWVEEKVRPFTNIRLEGDVDLSTLAPGDEVKIKGTSKGKGFTGVMKRHHFKGGPATHGQSDRARASGAIGSGTTPGRVVKGKKMAGRSGHWQVSIRTRILAIDSEKKIVSLLGPLPGAYGSKITLNKIKTL